MIFFILIFAIQFWPLKVLIIDNYDSFTYNLVHYVEQFVEEVVVWRNDELMFEQISEFDKLILSPGPGLPSESGQLMEVIRLFHDTIPILGVCLGLQGLVEHFGGTLENMQCVLHGKVTSCTLVEEHPIFKQIASPFKVGHYHSWVATESELPAQLEVLAKNDLGYIMAIRHVDLPIVALQFHPESVLTPEGLKMIENWVNS